MFIQISLKSFKYINNICVIFANKNNVKRGNHQRKLFDEPRNTVDTREAQEYWNG